MKKRFLSLVLVIVMVVSVSVNALAIEGGLLTGEIEQSGGCNEVYIEIPDGCYDPIAIYDGDEYIGTVQRLPDSTSRALIAPRASYSVNWTIDPFYNAISMGSITHNISNTYFSYSISASRSSSTDFGFYRQSTGTYFWLDYKSASTSFSGSCQFSINSDNMNFAIRNNSVYSTTYTGTYSLS